MGFEFAAREDAEGILRIMEEDTAPGGLKLLYTRRDDPLSSFLSESHESAVGVIKKDGRVIATIAAIPRLMYINGRESRVCYVTNMKRLPGVDIQLNWYEMFEKMCKKVNCDIYFCSLITGNDDVERMLGKKRKFMPYSVKMTGYKTYIISPSVKIKAAAAGVEFVRAAKDDEEGLVRFLNENGRKRNLFPVFDKLSDLGDLGADDFYLLKRDGNIVAAGALWDRRNVKQYVLVRCSGIYAWIRRINVIISKLGYITLPKDGQAADFAFISFLTAKDDDAELYRYLLKMICAAADDRAMLVTGTDVSNPKYGVLEGIRSVSFTSMINEIIMTNIDKKVPEHFDGGNLELECALL
ncbi:MAG: hypothetical protein IKS84_03605 [Lachnospiraceae bacterium]|nr:hypothetical protein [Lachnospiraceae bacterium]